MGKENKTPTTLFCLICGKPATGFKRDALELPAEPSDVRKRYEAGRAESYCDEHDPNKPTKNKCLGYN